MKEKLTHIDSLRGIAILMVILVHTGQSISGLSNQLKTIVNYGQLGVQLFFVISAFTLCLSAERRDAEPGKFKKYLIRRFFRIAPLYYFGILWYFFYRSLPASLDAGTFQPAEGYTATNLLANFLFVHGFYPPANNNIVPGGWSIGTEMIFYLSFPILYFFFKTLSHKSTSQFLISFALFIGLYYLFENWYLSKTGTVMQNNLFIYYNILNQLPVFSLGILAYFLTKNGTLEKIPTTVNFILFLTFAWMTKALWHTNSLPQNQFIYVPFTAGIAFLFLYNLFSKVEMLNHPVLQRIGQVSYSMYILHFMIAWYGINSLNHYLDLGQIVSPGILLVVYYIATVTLSFALAIVSEKFIEKPGVDLGNRWIKKKFSINHPQ